MYTIRITINTALPSLGDTQKRLALLQVVSRINSISEKKKREISGILGFDVDSIFCEEL